MPRYILETAEPLTEAEQSRIGETLALAQNAYTLAPMCRRLEIHGRRWFQKSYGNTYHTVTIVLDGVTVYKSGKTYGYGSQYVQTAIEWLRSVGHLPDDYSGFTEGLRELFDYTGTVQDVPRERDL